MNRNIEFIDKYGIRFTKEMWGPDEIKLAKCYDFDLDFNKGAIIVDLEKTTKRALSEFMTTSYPSLMEGPNHQKNEFSMQVRMRYDEIAHYFNELATAKVPYWGIMRQHQKYTLMAGHKKKHNLFALDMGLGKTATGITMSILKDHSRTVILSKVNGKWNWFRDPIDPKFGFDEIFFTMLDQRAKNAFTAFIQEKYVISSFESTKNFLSYITEGGVDHLIIDECQKIKNVNTSLYRTCEEIVEACNPDITYLSGTPQKNRINDMFAYHKLSKKHLGDSYADFLKEFTIKNTVEGKKGKVVSGNNLDTFNKYMANWMVRYRKRDCIDLPRKEMHKLFFEEDDYKEEYDRILRQMAEAKDIRQITGHIHSLNRLVSKSKAPGLIEFVEQLIDEGRKVVMFSFYRDTLDIITKHFGKRAVCVQGGVDAADRDKMIQRFYNDPECVLFAGQTLAAGDSINLTNSHTMVFCDLPLTWTEFDQAVSRIDRMGQKNPMDIYIGLGVGAICEYLWDLIVDKAGDIAAAIDGKAASETEAASVPEKLFKLLMNKKFETAQ